MNKMADWTFDMIRFMRDASEYSSYFSQLAKVLKPYLVGCTKICDVGCGLGQLAVALSGFVSQIDAIDINKSAIEELESNIVKSNIHNVNAIQTDILSYEPQKKYDAMIFNNYGSMEEVFSIAKRCCCGKIIVIKRAYPNHRFSIGTNPIHGYTEKTAYDFLNSKGLKFTDFSFECEFGQPFRSVDDAVVFFKLYSKDSNPDLINTESVSSKLEKTENEEFPFYLKSLKKNRIFVI